MTTEDLAVLSAEDLRVKGNEAFKEKRFHKAISYYSESLSKNLDHVVLSNRSQAFLKIEYYEAAMSDASESIKLSPTAKAYYRRATAMHHLGFHSKAREDLKHVLKLEPKNREAADFLDKILITHDRPIIPLRLLQKKPYVQSKKPMKQIPIEDLVSNLEVNDAGSSSSPVDSGVSSITDTSFVVQLDDEPLPLPAQTSMDLVVALSTLKFQPKRLVEYFMTLNPSNFGSIFSAGVEPDFLEALLGGISDAPKTSDFLERLVKLATCDGFETSLMFTPHELKNDLKTYLSQLTKCDSLAKRVSDAYEL